jgi:acetate kinase
MADSLLVINAGSSSLKFQLFDVAAHDQLELRLKGQIDGIGSQPRLLAKSAAGDVVADKTWQAAQVSSLPAALDMAIPFLREQVAGSLPLAVGHRVVHGGPEFSHPALVTDGVLRRLERLAPLAPLHQLNNLAPIQAIMQRHPSLPQVACFDTAFHRGHPEIADRFAIPEDLYAEGVRRYGFHGLSYEYVAGRLREVAPRIASGRLVIAHLGSGASMCAIVAGRSVESTMGFTALDGLPMGTRPGQLDPGVVLYLCSEKRMSPDAVQHLLYNDCGLKGISGISNDVRVLLAHPSQRARLALDYFTHRICMSAGMLAAAMGGIDAIVFTAGIGENAPAVREGVLRRLSWLGADIDMEANARGGPRISTANSRVQCYVIATNEELMIARHTLRLLRQQG